MTEREQSILHSLDGDDYRIFPYLTYLLQDLWDIGTSPSIISGLIIQNKLHKEKKQKVLDLGCGKGAVGITLAKEFGFSIHGIDAHRDFIEKAAWYAREYSVEDRCTFEVGDIREHINFCRDYDILILGSIGPVLGSVEKTLTKAAAAVREGGSIFLDEGYYKENMADDEEKSEYRREEILKQIEKTSLVIVDEYVCPDGHMSKKNRFMYSSIKKRAFELMEQFPEKKGLFQQYLDKQQEENRVLEQEFECVTWVLRKKAAQPKLLV